MTARPRLVRSVPFWVLVIGSVAVGAIGLWLTLDKLGVMTTSILDGTATGVEVYAGQSWAVLGSILIGTGLIGLAFALTLAVVSSLLKREEPALVLADTLDEDEDEDEDLIVTSAPETVVADDASGEEKVLEAVSATTDATTDERPSTHKS